MNVGDYVTITLKDNNVVGVIVHIDPNRGIMVKEDLGNGCSRSRYFTGDQKFIAGNVIHQWIADARTNENQ